MHPEPLEQSIHMGAHSRIANTQLGRDLLVGPTRAQGLGDLACAAAYGAASKLEPSTVARLAAGDWRFWDRITEGATFTARKYDAIMGWFSANWPSDAPWPNDVPRPETVGEAA